MQHIYILKQVLLGNIYIIALSKRKVIFYFEKQLFIL